MWLIFYHYKTALESRKKHFLKRGVMWGDPFCKIHFLKGGRDILLAKKIILDLRLLVFSVVSIIKNILVKTYI
jgi:hypothetical protein